MARKTIKEMEAEVGKAYKNVDELENNIDTLGNVNAELTEQIIKLEVDIVKALKALSDLEDSQVKNELAMLADTKDVDEVAELKETIAELDKKLKQYVKPNTKNKLLGVKMVSDGWLKDGAIYESIDEIPN